MERQISSSTEHRAPARPPGFDCLECANGVYIRCETPFCSSCGARAPQAVIDTMRKLHASPAAA